MNAQKRVIIGVIALIVAIVLAVILWPSSGIVSDKTYPGVINQEDVDLPEDVRAAWTVQANLLEAKIAQYPDEAPLYMSYAVYARQVGDYAKARRAIETAIDLAPADRRGWIILGDIAVNMEDWETAEYAYISSQELASDETVYVKLEQLYRGALKEERYHLIEELYQEAIRQHGQLPMFMTRLAMWYEEEGRYEEAIEHLEVVEGLRPNDEEIQEALTRVRQLRANQ